MFKIHYWVLHLAMIAAGSYFVADMVNIALGSYIGESLSRRQRQSHSDNDVKKPRIANTQHQYRVIVHRNIFNSNKSNPLPANDSPLAALPVAAPAPLPPLNLTLIGTIVLADKSPFAVIREPKKKEQTIYRIGETIGKNSKIVEINRNKIVLLRGGRRETLELSVSPKQQRRGKVQVASRSVPPPSTTKSGSTIRKVADNRWLLDRREIDDAMKNLSQLLTKARIIPNFKDGKPDGFRIFAIARNSLYSKIGLQNGDILHRINGVEVKNPQNFMQVMEQLKDDNSINIDLVRNNKNETFNYDIR